MEELLDIKFDIAITNKELQQQYVKAKLIFVARNGEDWSRSFQVGKLLSRTERERVKDEIKTGRRKLKWTL
jgi:hypothetical protein